MLPSHPLLLREARTMAALVHPHVVAVRHVGTADVARDPQTAGAHEPATAALTATRAY